MSVQNFIISSVAYLGLSVEQVASLRSEKAIVDSLIKASVDTQKQGLLNKTKSSSVTNALHGMSRQRATNLYAIRLDDNWKEFFDAEKGPKSIYRAFDLIKEHVKRVKPVKPVGKRKSKKRVAPEQAEQAEEKPKEKERAEPEEAEPEEEEQAEPEEEEQAEPEEAESNEEEQAQPNEEEQAEPNEDEEEYEEKPKAKSNAKRSTKRPTKKSKIEDVLEVSPAEINLDWANAFIVEKLRGLVRESVQKMIEAAVKSELGL